MIGAFVKAPPMAWSGWRLTIPGGPAGGQYHGFVAQDGRDSLSSPPPPPGSPAPYPHPSPWDSVWGGIALREGENRSDFVFRSSAEIPPRANASGGANVVQGFQTKRTAGYAVAPGNYRGLGVVNPNIVNCPEEIFGTRGPGCTNRVAQPSPPIGPGSGYVTTYTAPPASPAPAPTVSATPTAAQPAGVSDWLSASTIVPGVENLWIAGAAALAAFLLLRRRA